VTGTDDAELRRRFEERQAEVTRYGKLWWSHQAEPQRSFLSTRPELQRELRRAFVGGANVILTRRVYGEAAGWARERVTLHQELVEQLVRGATPGPPAPGDPAYLTIGLPGSGKTRGLRPMALAHAGRLESCPVSDADDVRTALPEYRDGLGSTALQGETEEITYGTATYPPGGGLQDQVRYLSGAVVIDMVGGDYVADVVKEFAATGRAVYVLMTECSPDLCEDRVMRRAVEPGGRYVPLEVVRAKIGVPRAALEGALATGAVTGWGVWDTSTWPARLIEGDGTFDEVVLP